MDNMTVIVLKKKFLEKQKVRVIHPTRLVSRKKKGASATHPSLYDYTEEYEAFKKGQSPAASSPTRKVFASGRVVKGWRLGWAPKPASIEPPVENEPVPKAEQVV